MLLRLKHDCKCTFHRSGHQAESRQMVGTVSRDTVSALRVTEHVKYTAAANWSVTATHSNACHFVTSRSLKGFTATQIRNFPSSGGENTYIVCFRSDAGCIPQVLPHFCLTEPFLSNVWIWIICPCYQNVQFVCVGKHYINLLQKYN